MAVQRYDTIPGGGDDRKILAYVLFSGNRYEPGIGAESLVASADTVQELKDLPEVAQCEDYTQWQIIDTSTFKITDQGNWEDGVFIVDGVYTG
jgi:hypothetical protein